MIRAQFKPTRPLFAISILTGSSTPRGYHETYFEIVSQTMLYEADFKKLDELNLLGIGQAYYVLPQPVESRTIVDKVPAVMVDEITGQVVPGPAVLDNGLPITGTHDYTYHRYIVKRICDSGD